MSGRTCNKQIVPAHWAVVPIVPIAIGIGSGVPGVVGLLSLLHDKRAGTAAIPIYPDGLLSEFDVVSYGHKKSLLTQALLYFLLTLSDYFGRDDFSFTFLETVALTGSP